MIRSVIAFFVFAALVCATIILRSGPDGTPAAATPAVDTPAPEVTRSEVTPMALPAAASRVSVPQGSQPPRTPAIRTDGALSMEDMTTNVLAELGLLPETAMVPAPEAAHLDATASAIAGIGAITGRQTPVAPRDDLQSLVVAALRAGQDDASIDSLVNSAAADGRVAVPDVLVTSDGRVDTSVLLSNIITQAQVASGQAAPPARPGRIEDTRGVEVRLVQAAQGTREARFYTVQAGDSLGAIAIKFYGTAGDYPRIFDANRQTLSSPDMIRTGQRLVIPSI